MFTGLIEKTGIVKRLSLSPKGGTLEFICEFSDPETIKTGDSIAVNGVCLTICLINGNTYTADVMLETLELTNLKDIKAGDVINLERAMLINSRFDGHIVQGHIDTTASIEKIIQDGFSKRVSFKCNTELIIKKGSVAINGVSLTVTKVEDGFFEVSLIPTTIKDTNLRNLKTGDIVNIEYDITGKYIRKFVKELKTEKSESKITEEFLIRNGFY